MPLSIKSVSIESAPIDIAICIPVRNEDQTLPHLIDALAHQQDLDRSSVTVCFFLDGCDDHSADVIERARASMPYAVRTAHSMSAGRPNAGRARRLAMDVGLAAIEGRSSAILLTTDADTVPAPDWIGNTVAALDHADVVTGDIHQLEDGFSHHHARVKSYFDRLHHLNTLIDPVPWEAPRSHHHTGGASMALSCDTYRALGGFLDLPRGEDAALVMLARHRNFRVRRDASVVVHTSTRRYGRVEDGFSAHLRSLDEAGGADRMLVVDPHVAADQYRWHARARHAFASGDQDAVAALATALGLDPHSVIDLRSECPGGEAFATRVVPMPVAAAPMPLIQAEDHLERLIQSCRSDGELVAIPSAQPYHREEAIIRVA